MNSHYSQPSLFADVLFAVFSIERVQNCGLTRETIKMPSLKFFVICFQNLYEFIFPRQSLYLVYLLENEFHIIKQKLS